MFLGKLRVKFISLLEMCGPGAWKRCVRKGAELQIAIGTILFFVFIIRWVNNELSSHPPPKNPVGEVVFVMYLWFLLVSGFVILLGDDSYLAMKWSTMGVAVLLVTGLILWPALSLQEITRDYDYLGHSAWAHTTAWILCALLGFGYFVNLCFFTRQLKLEQELQMLADECLNKVPSICISQDDSTSVNFLSTSIPNNKKNKNVIPYEDDEDSSLSREKV